jgi:hypothetical protein
MTQNKVCTTRHPGSNRSKEGTMTVLSHELAALYLILAEERAEKKRLETTNQGLVKDLLVLTQDYDELTRRATRKEQEHDQVVQALKTSSMECSSLGKKMEQTMTAVKPIFAACKEIRDLRRQVERKGAFKRQHKNQESAKSGEVTFEDSGTGEKTVSLAERKNESRYRNGCSTKELRSVPRSAIPTSRLTIEDRVSPENPLTYNTRSEAQTSSHDRANQASTSSGRRANKKNLNQRTSQKQASRASYVTERREDCSNNERVGCPVNEEHDGFQVLRNVSVISNTSGNVLR